MNVSKFHSCLLLFAFSIVFVFQGQAQYSYNYTTPQSCGGGGSTTKYFTLPGTPLTTIGGTITVYWVACKQSGNPSPYAELWIDIGGAWDYIGKGISPNGCSWQNASWSISSQKINDAINTAPGGQIDARVYIQEYCQAGVGCSGFNDPCAKVKLEYHYFPHSLFDADITTSCVGGAVVYSDASTGPITNWEWDFGAGANPPTATTQGPHSVQYTTPGPKTVTLILTDPTGSDTLTKANYVDVFPGPSSIISGSVNEAWQAVSNGGVGHYPYAMATDHQGNYFVSTRKSNAGSGYDVYTIKYDAGGTELWNATYNGSGNGNDEPRAITVDDSGNVYVAALVTGGGGLDFGTIKYTASGVEAWSVEYAGTGGGNDEPQAIVVDTSYNVFVTGWISQASVDFGLVKYNQWGLMDWDSFYDGPGAGIDHAYDIALDGTGNIYVAGYARNSFNYDIALVKFNFLGQVVWDQLFNGAGAADDFGYDMLMDSKGNLVVMGSSRPNANYSYTFVKYDQAGAFKWKKDFFNAEAASGWDYQRMVIDDLDNIYFVAEPMNAGTQEIALVKIDSLGNQDWDSRFAWLSSTINVPHWIEIGDSANIFVFGTTDNGSNNDVVTIKFDSSGTEKWNAVYNGCASEIDYAVTAVVGTDDNVVVAGRNSQTFVIKYAEFFPPAAAFGLSTSGICFGDTLQLTDASGGSITSWSWDFGIGANPATANTQGPHDVTYTSTGSKTVKLVVTGPLGTDSTTQSITVNALPTANAGMDVAICQGDTAALNATGGNSYLWSPAAGLNAVNVANPQASPVATTTYAVQVTDLNGCKDMDDVLVTVNALPVSNAGMDTSICEGDTIQLNGSGGTAYAWSPATSLSATNIANPMAFPVNTITYTLMVTDANNCEAEDDMTITVLPAPPADAGTDTSICLGESIQLNASGGGTYLWTPASGLSAPNVANPLATPVATTLYNVLVTGANGCTKDDEVMVTVFPQPVGGFNYSVAGTVVTFSNTSTNFISSSWDFGDGNSSSNPSPTYSYINYGTYYVCLTVQSADGCEDMFCDSVKVLLVGIEDMKLDHSIELYPNPNSGVFTLSFDMEKADLYTIRVSDIQGKTVFLKENAQGAGRVTEKLKLPGLNAGEYFLRLTTMDGEVVRKLVLE